MIGTSVWELVFIRVCIFVIEYSLLLSGCITAVLFAIQGTSTASWVFCCLFVVDALYCVFLYLPFKVRLSRAANHPELLTRRERDALFHQCWVNIPDPERYLRVWFLDGDPAEIKRDNVKELFLWAFFDRGTVEDATGDGQALDAEAPETLEEELEDYLVRTEELLGRPLEPGKGTAVPLRLTIDVVETRYRSVWWYAVVGLVDFTTYCFLVWHGFEFHCPPVNRALAVFPIRAQALLPTLTGKLRRLHAPSASHEMSYWCRPHTSPDTLPVLFIHGIGIGLHPYTKFLAEIPEGTGVIALEILPISMRLSSAPLSQPAFLDQVGRILAHHGPGWDRFVVVSHSYGSVLTTHILRSADLAPRVAAVVLVDPVSLLLHLPDIAYNFTRRRPRRANEWQLWYFASMDPGTALALGRHFFWRENLIWKEELVAQVGRGHGAGMYSDDGAGEGAQAQLPTEDGQRKRKVAVCLSGRDLIVDTLTVARYLVADRELSHLETHNEAELDGLLKGEENYVTKLGIEVLWFPPLDHSQVFDGRKDRERLLSVVGKYCDA